MFRSAMCPNCDGLMKLDSESENVFCAGCGIQLQAQDAFVYFDLKTGGEADISKVTNVGLLMKCGKDFLEQKKHDLADACFSNILKKFPEDYQVWKLSAFSWESRIINEYRELFYEYDKVGGLKEKKAYLSKYRELCGNAVRHCPGELAGGLAEEFNDHIRSHFNIAHKAYIKEKRKANKYALLAALSFVAVAALMLSYCRA